jgi:hypothetical protein
MDEQQNRTRSMLLIKALRLASWRPLLALDGGLSSAEDRPRAKRLDIVL